VANCKHGHVEPKRYKNGACMECAVIRRKAWAAANPEKAKAARLAWNRRNPDTLLAIARRRLYGVSKEQVAARLVEQAHCCAICRAKPASRLVLDHDHETGKFRGMLCGHCNRAIGLLRDDPHVVDNAAAYLRKHA
jgi:hypothetical protein